MNRNAAIRAVVLALVGVCGFAQQPFTFGDADLKILADAERVTQRFALEGLVLRDERVEEYMSRVAQRLLPNATLQNVDWRFHVLRTSTPKALSFPNGSVYVTSGMIALLENETQLAGVLAHEIAHVEHRHGYLRMREYRRRSLTLSIIGAASIAGSVVQQRGTWSQVLRVAAVAAPMIAELIYLAHSREDERESDATAVERLRAVNLDPLEMARHFRRLLDDPDLRGNGGLLSTHPRLDDRIRELEEALPPAGLSTPLAPSPLEPSMASVRRHNVTLLIEDEALRPAVEEAQALVDSQERAEHYYLLGEAYRSLGPWPLQPAFDEARFLKGLEKRLKTLSTPNEVKAALLKTLEGESAWEINQTRAEEAYKKSLSLGSGMVKSYRSLGLLYEAGGKPKQAVEAYREYLGREVLPPDRVYVERRMRIVEASSK